MKVSVISTVKNEGPAINRLMQSLLNQTRQPDEVIICDGGSSDDTVAILENYKDRLPLKILVAPGANISQGRNRAIEAASGPIIAGTDAGVRLTPLWLAELVRPIEEDGALVVAGWFEADPQSGFETVMGATVLPALSDIKPENFLPSSRSVAFLKHAWQTVGGYPEWLDFGEDLVFDLALRKEFGLFSFVPAAKVFFRPRANLQAFARQYYHYARGDGKANLWPKRHFIRYTTYLLGVPLLIEVTRRGYWPGLLLAFLAGSLYCRRPAQRLAPYLAGVAFSRQLGAYALIPIIRLVGDLAKMSGYPVGVIWRLQRRR